MRYYLSRGGQQYGPYTMADLQNMLAQGQIYDGDLAWKEGTPNWVPIREVLGPGPVATPQAPPAATPGSGPAGYAPTQAAAVHPSAGGHIPQDLHWALVLVIAIFTCGIFSIIWAFIEAAFVKKLRPALNAMPLMVGYIVLVFGGYAAAIASREPFMSTIASLAGVACWIIAMFQIKAALEDYYNREEPINLRLNGVLVFFFNVLYFQYHFSRIAKWKKTGVLDP